MYESFKNSIDKPQIWLCIFFYQLKQKKVDIHKLEL